MIEFKDLKATTAYGVDFINITFSLEDTIEDLTRYRFDVYRSYAESGNFSVVFCNIQNFEFNDYSVNLLNPEVHEYYKIKAVNLDTNEFIFSEMFSTPYVNPDNYSYYLNSIYSTYLNDVVNGREMYLLKRIRNGELCICYDDVRGSRKADRCLICFGTGYKGGYFSQIPIKVNFANVSSITEGMNPAGTFEETSQVQFWTLGYPLIQENDVIVDSLTKERSKVVRWDPSYKDGLLLRQTITVDKLPEASLYYKIPIIKG